MAILFTGFYVILVTSRILCLHAAPLPNAPLLTHPSSIAVEDSAWKKTEFDSFVPPSGVTWNDLLEHSKRDLLATGLKRDDPLQVSAHRGLSANYERRPENTLGALLAAVTVANIAELDVVVTRDRQVYAAHDWNTNRISLLQNSALQRASFWHELNSDAIDGQPVIIRDIREGRFTDQFVVTDEALMTLDEMLPRIFAVNPGATISLDARNDDGGYLVDWVFRHSQYHDRVIVEFYTFTFIDGKAFTSFVDGLGTPSGWRERVAVMPILFATELTKVAAHYFGGARDSYKTDYRTLYQSGVLWIDSLLAERMRIFAISLIIAGSGERCNLDTGKAYDRSGGLITDPEAIADFCWDRVLIELSKYLYSRNILCSGICRSYDVKSRGREFKYNFDTGQPEPWHSGPRRELFEDQALPGVTAPYHQFVISDRPLDSLSAAAASRLGIPYSTSIDYPVNNAD